MKLTRSPLHWQLRGYNEEILDIYLFEDKKQFADTWLKRADIPGQGDLPEFYTSNDWETSQGKQFS